MESRTIVGIVGFVFAAALYLSPLTTILKIHRSKSVLSYRPDLYVISVMTCLVGILYSLPSVHPHSLLLLPVNLIGLVLELLYLGVFFIHSTWPMRKQILQFLLAEGLLIAVVFATTFALHRIPVRTAFVGIVSAILNIAMYSAPLSIMKEVIRTKSVVSLPCFPAIASFLNGILWASYALIKIDFYILIPSSLGAISGFVQLILYAAYYKSTNWGGSPLLLNTNP